MGLQALADRADLDRPRPRPPAEARKGKSVATIGISTSYGEGFLKAFEAAAPQRGFKIVATEKYNQTDPSVTAQVLKIVAANPDAVYIFAAGTPGALPQIELASRGYKGLVYQTQGVANNDFLRVGGKSLEGSFMTVAPVLVAEQLPESNPTRRRRSTSSIASRRRTARARARCSRRPPGTRC